MLIWKEKKWTSPPSHLITTVEKLSNLSKLTLLLVGFFSQCNENTKKNYSSIEYFIYL